MHTDLQMTAEISPFKVNKWKINLNPKGGFGDLAMGSFFSDREWIFALA